MRARAVVLLSVLPLAFAATSASAQWYSRDCTMRPNDRGGTYISCSRNNDFARDQRRIASEVRREARDIANRARAESRRIAAQVRSEARADARAFQRHLNAERIATRVRARLDARRFDRPTRFYQRW